MCLHFFLEPSIVHSYIQRVESLITISVELECYMNSSLCNCYILLWVYLSVYQVDCLLHTFCGELGTLSGYARE